RLDFAGRGARRAQRWQNRRRQDHNRITVAVLASRQGGSESFTTTNEEAVCRLRKWLDSALCSVPLGGRKTDKGKSSTSTRFTRRSSSQRSSRSGRTKFSSSAHVATRLKRPA